MTYDTTLAAMGEVLRNSNWPVIVAILMATCLTLPGLYVACYLKLSDTVVDFGGCLIDRYYHAQWQARLFQPAARLDTLFTGRSVVTSAWRDTL